MYERDYIMREIQNMTQFIAKLVFERNTQSYTVIDEFGNLSQIGLLHEQLNHLIYLGKINEAENLLFDSIKSEPDMNYLQLAVDFYSELNHMSHTTLRRNNFSPQEIAEGLNDVKKFYGIK